MLLLLKNAPLSFPPWENKGERGITMSNGMKLGEEKLRLTIKNSFLTGKYIRLWNSFLRE